VAHVGAGGEVSAVESDVAVVVGEAEGGEGEGEKGLAVEQQESRTSPRPRKSRVHGGQLGRKVCTPRAVYASVAAEDQQKMKRDRQHSKPVLWDQGLQFCWRVLKELKGIAEWLRQVGSAGSMHSHSSSPC
jgi:hypothetical protein